MKPVEFTVNLPHSVDQVWNAWTTERGIKGFFAPECNIDLRPDGPYEILFDPSAPAGSRGAEGMKILAVEPPGFFSFTWNGPPSIPSVREQRMWVEIRIGESSGGCVLSLVNGGYGNSEDWAKAREYFQRAWGEVVLPRLEIYLSDGPVNWNTEE